MIKDDTKVDISLAMIVIFFNNWISPGIQCTNFLNEKLSYSIEFPASWCRLIFIFCTWWSSFSLLKTRMFRQRVLDADFKSSNNTLYNKFSIVYYWVYTTKCNCYPTINIILIQSITLWPINHFHLLNIMFMTLLLLLFERYQILWFFYFSSIPKIDSTNKFTTQFI